MKKLLGIGLILLTAGFVVGCVTKSGTDQLSKLSSEKVDAMITPGRTTKQEILAYFGHSYAVEEDSKGQEKWVYSLTKKVLKATAFIPYVNLLHNGTNNTHYKLTVIYDENDVVVKYNFHTFEDETKGGALAGVM